MTSNAGPEIRLAGDHESVNLPESLAASAGFVGLDPWLRLINRTYGFPAYRILAGAGYSLEGCLSLVRVRHPIFGDYLTTAPFGSYGGIAFTSRIVREALLDRARSLSRELGAGYVNIRFDTDAEPPGGWVQNPVYATYLIALTPDPLTLIGSYSSDHRNHIRKSMKKGFSIRFGRLDLLDDTYETLARSMHELGSPYHPKRYLQTMAECLAESLEFAVVYGARGEQVGAGVFIVQGERVTNLHANILRRFRPDYAGEFLYWSAIERYGTRGLREFDLGRSLTGSGNETFKLKWKPQKKPLAYWYALPPGQQLPALNQQNPKFQLAIALWKRLPGFVVRALGPALIKGLA